VPSISNYLTIHRTEFTLAIIKLKERTPLSLTLASATNSSASYIKPTVDKIDYRSAISLKETNYWTTTLIAGPPSR